MAYEFGALEASLSASVGDDPELVAELRRALIDSARHHADLLGRARCDGNWEVAAHRLKSLAASFGISGLLEAANVAVEAAPGDPVALRKVNRALELLVA
jgi:HPt (histidine-containing phosphotransfer) domain-containing protein